MVDREWWTVPAWQREAEVMLVRAGILAPDSEARRAFACAPWAWTSQVQTCQRLEEIMRARGVDPREGWDMTLLELASCEPAPETEPEPIELAREVEGEDYAERMTS